MRGKKILIDYIGAWGLGDLLCSDPLVDGLWQREEGKAEIRLRGKCGNVIYNPRVAGRPGDGWAPDETVDVRLFTHMPIEEYARLEALPSLIDHMCAYAGLCPPHRKPSLHLGEEERELAGRLPLEFSRNSPVVAMCTDFLDPYRHWPRERWAQVANHLLRRGARIVEMGIQKALGAGMDLCEARLPVRILGAVLERCDLFIGCNSGLFHYAQAAGTPCIILFSLALPQRFMHQGSLVIPVQADLPCKNCMTRDMVKRTREGCRVEPPGECMRSIPVSYVLKEIDRFLDEYYRHLASRKKEGMEAGLFRQAMAIENAEQCLLNGYPEMASFFLDRSHAQYSFARQEH